MANPADASLGQAWTLAPTGGLAAAALAVEAGLTAAANGLGQISVINAGGALECRTELAAPVRTLAASADGLVFAAFDDRGMAIGFGPDGKQTWTLFVGTGATAWDLGLSGRRLLVAQPATSLTLLAPGVEPVPIPCDFAASSAALIENGDDLVVAAGEDGDLALLDEKGAVHWRHKVADRCGPVRVSRSAGLIVVPAYEDGIQVLTLDGDGAGAFDVGEPVVAAAAAGAPAAPVIGALTVGGDLLIVDMDGTVLSEQSFDLPARDFAIAADASMLIVSLGSTNLAAYWLSTPRDVSAAATKDLDYGRRFLPSPTASDAAADDDGPTTAVSPGTRPEVAVPDIEIGDLDLSPGEEPPHGMPKGPHTVPEKVLHPRLVAKVRLPQSGALAARDQLLVSPAGTFAAMALSDGGVLVTDTEGNVLVSRATESPVSLLKKRAEMLLAAWCPEALVVISPPKRRTQTVDLKELNVRLLDCSERLDVAVIAGADGELLTMRLTGQVLARVQVTPSPLRLMMSPDGQTVLTNDGEGRIRFFNRAGECVRKQRFSAEEQFDHILLENAFCAFGGSQGHVILQDNQGKIASRRKVVERVSRMESLSNAVAVYDAGGRCVVMGLHGDLQAVLDPPVGDTLIRMPRGGEALALHAEGRALVALTGRSSELNTLWRFECKEPIRVFDADADARKVVIVTEERIYFIEVDMP